MSSTPNSVFTEVLEIKIDVTAFKDGLAALETEYDSFVDRVNAKGLGAGNVLGIGGFSGLTKDITNLQQQLDTYAEHFATSFQTLQETMGASATVLTSAVAGGAAKVDEAAARAKVSIGGVGQAAKVAGEQAQGGFGLFTQELVSISQKLPSIITSVAAYTLAYKAVNLAITAVVDVLKAPFEVIAAGVTYLEQLQEKAADLQGVLANGFKFSDNFAENFKIAGEQATIVSKEFEDFSNKTGIASLQIQNAFKAVVDAGGGKLTGGLEGAVKLAEDFAVMMRAAGSSIDTQRKLLSEVPKALEGTLPAASRLLQVLNMTPEAFKALVAEGREYGNLQDLLAERIHPFLSVIEQSETRLKVLNEENWTSLSRFAGVAAQPIFDMMIAGAQKLRAFLEEHKDVLRAIAMVVGDVASAIVRVIVAVAVWLGHFLNIAHAGEALGVALLVVLEAVTTILNAATGVFNIFTKMIELISNPASWSSPIETFKTFFSYVGQQADDFFAKLKKGGDEIQSVVDGTGQKDRRRIKNAPGSFDGKDIDAEKTLMEALKKLRAEYNIDVQNTKTYTQENIDKAREEAAVGTITFQEAHAKIKFELEEELRVLQALQESYEAKAVAIGGNSKAVGLFNEKLDETSRKLQRAAEHALSQANVSAAKEDESEQLVHYRSLEAMANAHAKAMLTIYKEEAALGLHSKLQVFDQERALDQQEYESEVGILEKELASATLNSAERKKIFDQLTAAEQKFTDKSKENSLTRETILHNETLKAQEDTQKLAELELQLAVAKEKGAEESNKNPQQIIEANQALAEQATKIAEINLALAVAARFYAEEHLDAEAIAAAKERELQAQVALQNAQNAEDKANNANIDATNLPSLIKGALKDGASSLKDAFDGFGASVTSLAGVFTQGMSIIKGIVGAVSTGYSQGGVLGAVGAGASQAAALDPEPISKAILTIGGGLLSFFGGLFTAHARKIAEQISKEMSATMQQYQNQSINLITAIGQLQAERQQAISQLSGQKGGQDQLNKLLPQLDQQIAALKLQQQQILINFTDQLNVLKLHSDTLGTVLTTWVNINKQVKDYLGAGGDAAKAAQFLSLNLEKLRASTLDSLQQGEASAVQEAISLNGLLQQRIDLTKQFNQQQFNTLNADAIERHSSAVDVGITAATAKQQYEKQLADLNNQVNQATLRVSKEKEIFNIATDTASLQARANALDLVSLDQQIQKWKDMQTIIKGIYQKPDGSFGMTSGFGTSIGAINVTVNTGGAPANGAYIAGEISKYLMDRGRANA